MQHHHTKSLVSNNNNNITHDQWSLWDHWRTCAWLVREWSPDWDRKGDPWTGSPEWKEWDSGSYRSWNGSCWQRTDWWGWWQCLHVSWIPWTRPRWLSPSSWHPPPSNSSCAEDRHSPLPLTRTPSPCPHPRSRLSMTSLAKSLAQPHSPLRFLFSLSLFPNFQRK